MANTVGGKTGYERDYYYNGKYFVVTGIARMGFLFRHIPKSIKENNIWILKIK